MVLTDWRTWFFVPMVSKRHMPMRLMADPRQYMLCTGAQTIQYFVPTLIGARECFAVEVGILVDPAQSDGRDTSGSTTRSPSTPVPSSSSSPPASQRTITRTRATSSA